MDVPLEHLRKIRLGNIGRIYRTPPILEQKVRIKDFPANIRQTANTSVKALLQVITKGYKLDLEKRWDSSETVY